MFDHQAEHLFDVDPVDGPQPLDEVGRRIAVGAPLSDVRESLGPEAMAERPLAGFARTFGIARLLPAAKLVVVTILVVLASPVPRVVSP